MPFRESIRQIAKGMQSCEEWLEMIRDLNAPVRTLQSQQLNRLPYGTGTRTVNPRATRPPKAPD